MIAIVFIAALAAGQIEADPQALHRIDAKFVCPEALPNAAAKIDALAEFDADMKTAVKDLTPQKLMAARLYLLRKHSCNQTLQNLARKGIR